MSIKESNFLRIIPTQKIIETTVCSLAICQTPCGYSEIQMNSQMELWDLSDSEEILFVNTFRNEFDYSPGIFLHLKAYI